MTTAGSDFYEVQYQLKGLKVKLAWTGVCLCVDPSLSPPARCCLRQITINGFCLSSRQNEWASECEEEAGQGGGAVGGVGGVETARGEKKIQKGEQWMHIIYSAVLHQTRIYNWNDKEDASPSQLLVLEAMNFKPSSWHLLYPYSVNH